MRAILFRKILGRLEQHTPDRLRSMEIQILMDLTARSFRVPTVKVWKLPGDRALQEYAQFTQACINKAENENRNWIHTGIPNRQMPDQRTSYRQTSDQKALRRLTSDQKAFRRLTSGQKVLRRQTSGQKVLRRQISDQKKQYHLELYKQAYIVGRCMRLLTGFTDQADIERLIFYLYRNIRITMLGRLPGAIHVPDCYFNRFYSPKHCAVMSCVDSGIIAGLNKGGRLRFTQRLTEGYDCCKACFSERSRS